MKEIQQSGIFLGTGANLGDRLENLKTVNRWIEQEVGPVRSASSIFHTEAWGKTDQPSFYNQVLRVDTELSPQELLDTILDIEEKMGRKRGQKWGSRLIDIDLLFYHQQEIQTDRLIVPHPFIAERNFVLAPMAEIAPGFYHPVHKKTIAELLEVSEDPLKCIPLKEPGAGIR